MNIAQFHQHESQCGNQLVTASSHWRWQGEGLIKASRTVHNLIMRVIIQSVCLCVCVCASVMAIIYGSDREDGSCFSPTWRPLNKWFQKTDDSLRLVDRQKINQELFGQSIKCWDANQERKSILNVSSLSMLKICCFFQSYIIYICSGFGLLVRQN